MFLEKHYQNAYVTPNIDLAIERLRAVHGTPDFMTIEASTPVWTPNGEGVATNKLALGWVGHLQYELIEPVSGPVGIYRDAISGDQLLRFHHVAMRADDWDRLLADVDTQKKPIVYRGETDGLKFIYVDARDTLGHYLEYVWATPEKWQIMGPR